jgi:hypothetical protein
MQNFWNLRDNSKAQPEMVHTAKLMREAFSASEPRELKPGEAHLPFVTQPETMQFSQLDCIKISTGRAAAVSYERHMMQDAIKDASRHDTMLSSGHMSPLEHPAIVATRHDLLHTYARFVPSEFVGNFRLPWIQYRKTIKGEDVFVDPDLTQDLNRFAA